MQYTKMRNAIAMIELIFALVVMGIVLMSAPMLISTSAKSSVVALQQEGINEAVSRVNMILTYPWDESDTNDSCIPSVLITTHGDDELNATGEGVLRRAGVPLASNSHSFQCQNLILSASTIGADLDDLDVKDDLDDFTGETTLLNVGGVDIGLDYIESTIRIINTISYISDTAEYNLQSSISYTPSTAMGMGETSNIKQIDINLTSSSSNSDLNKTIIFHAFSSNIGGIEYEGRTF